MKKLFKLVLLMLFISQIVYSSAIILNEYNGVESDKQLAHNGYDTYFGDINGNGGSWIELVVVKDYLDIRGATISIEQNGGVEPFSAFFPNLTQLAYLRRGTIITISNEPTDLSYEPLNDDWNINIYKDDLNTTQGTFITSNNELRVQIVSNNQNIIMPSSGEGIFHNGISNTEVFKLKKNPSISIAPDDPAYGDDNGRQIISTFGSPNEWIDTNGNTLIQNFHSLRDITASNSINKQVLLNEYNGVKPNQKLKDDGNDTFFGKIFGNGGSWLEFVILKDKIDLRNAKLIITDNLHNSFKGTLLDIEKLSNLRSGTIVTISNEPTDLSYNPFDIYNSDWNININKDDLSVIEGDFFTNNDELNISLVSGSGDVTIMPHSGEKILGSGIDSREVFKLKNNPSFMIEPNDLSYGDDNQQQALSSFGVANHWVSGGTLITQNFYDLQVVAKKDDFYKKNTSLLLNEYNAVAPNQQLKNNGYDTYFGSVNGNGGDWLEMVVTRDYLNLQNATLKISENGIKKFSAKFPKLLTLAYLRKGTIVTISNEPTDMSYFPFSLVNGDWKINININDLTNTSGTFNLNENNIGIYIVDSSGENTLLAYSGEEVGNNVIDNKEIYKLKSEPNINITPYDSSYGDDNDSQAISTFGSPNQWRDGNGVIQSQKLIVRNDKDLNETDGIALEKIASLGEQIKDGESILYIPVNNSLWIADDDSHAVYEMDLTTKEIKSTFNDVDLGEFAPDIEDSCHDRLGACDIESIAYDENNDTLYILTGHSPGTPAVFKLTREDINESFVLTDYRKLGDVEYPAAQFINGDFIVSTGKKLYKYDFETNQLLGSSLYTTNRNAQLVGLAYKDNTLFITTIKHELIKVNWETKEDEYVYDMRDNGVYDSRGVEIIGKKLYILDGINEAGKNQATAPQGHVLKNAIHIYSL